MANTQDLESLSLVITVEDINSHWGQQELAEYKGYIVHQIVPLGNGSTRVVLHKDRSALEKQLVELRERNEHLEQQLKSVQETNAKLHELRQHVGCYAIDKDPQTVTYDWIQVNAFQITDPLKN